MYIYNIIYSYTHSHRYMEPYNHIQPIAGTRGRWWPTFRGAQGIGVCQQGHHELGKKLGVFRVHLGRLGPGSFQKQTWGFVANN